MVHYELLPTGQTITGDLYSQQLERVQQALRQKEPALVNRKGILFLHDNARPHVARVVRDTIQQLGWETLYHPPYSPDLAATDYHLFHSLDNPLRGKSFTNETDLCQALTNFFASKTRHSTARVLNSWRLVGRRCWMPMAITLKTKYKLHILLKVFPFFHLKTDRTFLVTLYFSSKYKTRA